MNHFIITGTSRGIGKALAELLLEEENNLVSGVARHNTIDHDRYRHHDVDLSNLQDLNKALDKIFETKNFEKVTLINNAGTLGQIKYIGDLDNDKIEKLYNVNVIAPVILLNSFIQFYQDPKIEKLILNVTSGAGSYPVDGWSGYCSSKAALNMVSEVTAKENKIMGNNLRIYSVAPGIVDTDMQKEIRHAEEKSFSRKDMFIDYKDSNKLMDPNEAAKKLLFIIKSPHKFDDVSLDVRLLDMDV